MIKERVFSEPELLYFWVESAAKAKREAELCFRHDCLAKDDFIQRETRRLYRQRTQP